ncbi:hypothetical protein Rcae01_04730 [Novipirellula caenicola]|uniref:Uncharacterized protein n=1 Tax=Novipirellula caenicola TaxID=1536901 RepID=A0ABP9VWM5_9BACT
MHEKVFRSRLPTAFGFVDSATGDNEVHVRMVDHGIASPGVQDAEEAELAPGERTHGTRHVTNRVTTAVEDGGVAFATMAAQQRTQFLGNRKSDQEVMHRQQSFRLLGEPTLRLVLLAVGAVTIATRATDEVFRLTLLAFDQDTAQRASAAAGDRIQDDPHGKRHSVAESLKQCRCVLSEAARNGGHRLASAKDLFDRFSGVRLGGVGQVQVDHRSLQAAMTEILLNDL